MNRDNPPAHKPFAPERRCHWFDANGRPYRRLDTGLGCPRGGKCYFAHPTDLEAWRNARPGGDPPLHYLTDDEYRLIMGRHRSPQRAHFHPGPRPRSISPVRRRSPPRRPPSRGREVPTLVARIRGRTLSREREVRALRPRNSRSRSPVRARPQRTPPPPRGPRMSIGGPPPDGPRGLGGPSRSPMIFPKVETDVSMRDVMRDVPKPVHRRDDSAASSHHRTQQIAPSASRATGVPAAPSARPTTNVQVQALMNAASASGSGTTPPPQSDAIKALLESSTLQWQQISSAVAAASSVTPAKPRAEPLNKTPGRMSTEDKADIWSCRIELLAEATRVHNDCRNMESDVRDYKQLVDSFSYQSLPAEDRTVIEGHLTAIQAQLAEKSEEMKTLLTQLADAKFWPTHSDQARGSSPQESGQEIVKHVQGLKVSVSQLQGLFQTLGTRWEQVSKSLQSNRLSSIGNHSFDIPGAAQGGVGQSSTLIAEALMPKELDKIRSSIASFDERLKNVEKAATNSSEIVSEQIDVVVAENVQALMLAATGSVQATPPPPRPANALTAQQRQMLETLQQNAVVTAQQVQQLSQKVTEMAAANEQLQGENVQLQAENARLRQQLSESMAVQLPASGETTKLDEMQSEMRALNAAVVAYLSQRPSTGPSGSSADAIAEHILNSLPKVIAPELHNLHDQIQETIRSQHVELLKELTSNMTSPQHSATVIRDSADRMHPQADAHMVPGSPVNGNDIVKGEVTSDM
ncbi:hypothetical protein BC628DRAFT_1321578 [Trametes gibbosa]|nr:hypothetical protein BC628DRAFT_1321578 [Trametes gibbosa]